MQERVSHARLHSFDWFLHRQPGNKSGVTAVRSYETEGEDVSILGKAVVYLFFVLPGVAQSQAFQAITIQPDRSGDTRNARMQVLPSGDVVANAVPVIGLLRYAYAVPINPSPRLSGLPEWAIRERYNIQAKAPVNAVPPGLPASEVRERARQMLRTMLADRFKLVMRDEPKTMAVYALTVAGGGPKLERSPITDKDCTFDSDPEGCHSFIGGLGHPLHAKAIDMDDLAGYIENWSDLPVVNRTGISGLFAVNTEGWRAMRLPPPPPPSPNAAPPSGLPDASDPALPTIFTVLAKLGLELKRQEATMPVFTVEHIERAAAK